MGAASPLVPPLPGPRLLTLDIINRCNNPSPHRRAFEVALIEHGVGFHGGLDSRRFAVLLDQGVG